MKELHLYTIGYQGRNIDEFLEILSAEKIELVVDIRGNAFSRKPGFSKNKLKDNLSSSGIEYEHLKELGTPKELMNRVKKAGNLMAFKDEFEELFDGKKDSLLQLLKLIESKKTCLMCFEKATEECHRTFIIKQLIEITGGSLMTKNL